MAFPFSPKERDQKRAEMNSRLEEYARLHVQYILDKEVHPSTKKRILSAFLSTCTTGMGKSMAVALLNKILAKYNLPLLIVVKNHDIAREYVERVGAHEYFGKQETVEQWKAAGKLGPHPAPKSVCYKIDITKRASEQGHRPSVDVCKNKCEHGKAGVIKFSTDEIAIQKARVWMENNKFSADDVPHCPYLYEGLPAARSARVLVMPVQAFSDTFGDFEEKNGVVVVNRVPRLVVFDEKVDLTREARIRTADISEWIDELQKLQVNLTEKAEKLIKRASDGHGELIKLINNVDPFTHNKLEYIHTKKATREALVAFVKTDEYGELDEADQNALMDSLKLLNILRLVRRMFNQLSRSITEYTPIKSKQILTTYRLTKKCRAFTRGTAKWESIGFVNGQYSIPLKALQLLATNIEGKTWRQGDNQLFIYEVTPPLEWAMTRGSTIFLDATATPAMSSIIRMLGGAQFDSILCQNIRVERIVGKSYGKGHAKTPESAVRLSTTLYQQIKEIASQLKERSGDRPCALLTHKSVFESNYVDPKDPQAAQKMAEIFFEETGVKGGWFNLHDRAHNNWDQHNLAIVGMEWLPKDVMEKEYHQARVALQYCGEEWPEWSGEWAEDHLPRRQNERHIIIQRMAESLIQAIGRPRGLNNDDQEPYLIQLWGGLQNQEMDDALKSAGIHISERIPNWLHKNLEQYYGRDTDTDGIDRAIEMLQTVGARISIREVGKALRVAGGSADDKAIKGRIEELREAGKLPPASKGGRPAKVSE